MTNPQSKRSSANPSTKQEATVTTTFWNFVMNDKLNNAILYDLADHQLNGVQLEHLVDIKCPPTDYSTPLVTAIVCNSLRITTYIIDNVIKEPKMDYIQALKFIIANPQENNYPIAIKMRQKHPEFVSSHLDQVEIAALWSYLSSNPPAHIQALEQLHEPCNIQPQSMIAIPEISQINAQRYQPSL